MTKLKILLVSILIGLAGSCILGGCRDDAKAIQNELSEKLLRFHVIANSDSGEDQALKLKVKDAVIDYISPYLHETMTLEETKAVLEEQKENILSVAGQVIAENGYDYSVSASITNCWFPIKTYGDITLPAGEYEAFRIEIGECSGKNWWCILYPPLCFVDVSYGVVPEDSKLLLKNILDEDVYNSITKKAKVSYRFRFFTFLNDLFD